MENIKFPEPDLEYMTRIRREIHAYPELGFELEHTVMVVERELTALGIPYTEKYGKGSVVGYIGPEQAKKTIGLRGDMDALPIEELRDLPFASKIPGKMHACGHDTHTTVLLGAAKILKAIEKDLKCRVKLIFQPAEEICPSGGEMMVNNGVMDDVDEVITTHIKPGLPTGKISLNKTCMNASCHSFVAKVYGKRAHVAYPEQGVDAIAIANRFYMAIQEMRAREVSPFEPLIINVGAMNGGTAANIICDYVEMAVTVRTHSDVIDDFVYNRINLLAQAACLGQEGHIDVEWDPLTPAVHNDHKIADRIIDIGTRLLGAENVENMPLQMGSEDFAFYLRDKPGARFMYGCASPEVGPTVGHNGNLFVDENAFPVPVKIFVTYVLENMED